MQKTTNNNILETIVEEINCKFDNFVIAQEKGNYLYLTLRGKRANNCWELEEIMEGVFEYAIKEFNVDFNIVNYNQKTLVVEVYTY